MFWFFFKDNSPKGMNIKEEIKIGDILYSVQEHLYYDRNIQVAPLKEYIVVEGKAARFIKGSYTEVAIHAEVDHVLHVYYYKTSDLEKCLFRKYEDAVQAAIRVTDEYERIWGRYLGKLRRPWENEDRQQKTEG